MNPLNYTGKNALSLDENFAADWETEKTKRGVLTGGYFNLSNT
jgi:hypothetical protein